jgi:Mn-dependent DtxR family transcriptional regulator
LADTDSPVEVLREVRGVLRRRGLASLSELERELGIRRSWLSGFMGALEALGVVECKGTRTFKIYVLGRAEAAAGSS